MTDDLIRRFELEYQGYHGISDERARQQRDVLRDLAEHAGKSLAEIDCADLSAYAGTLVQRKLHVNTVRKKLNMIRPFVSWAYAVGVIDSDRYMKLKAVKNPRGSSGNTLPKPYTRQEIVTFWAQLDQKYPKLPSHGRGSQLLKRWLQGKSQWGRVWRHAMRLQLDAMVRLALDMGLRRHEIYGLSVNDCHYDLEYLVVMGKADPNTGQPKVREVPFTDAAREAIKVWLEFRALMRPDHDRPWVTCYTHWESHPMRERRFNGLLHEAVGEGWAWHRFRHTCGTEWLRSGMTLENVSRLLGHATLTQTLGYAEIAKGDVARDMAKNEGTFKEAVASGV